MQSLLHPFLASQHACGKWPPLSLDCQSAVAWLTDACLAATPFDAPSSITDNSMLRIGYITTYDKQCIGNSFILSAKIMLISVACLSWPFGRSHVTGHFLPLSCYLDMMVNLYSLSAILQVALSNSFLADESCAVSITNHGTI